MRPAVALIAVAAAAVVVLPGPGTPAAKPKGCPVFPASWPTKPHQALDHEFMGLLRDGRLGEARRFLDVYARETHVEMGGRNLASMLGVLDGMPAARLQGALYGEYGPSSGAGHTNFGIAVH